MAERNGVGRVGQRAAARAGESREATGTPSGRAPVLPGLRGLKIARASCVPRALAQHFDPSPAAYKATSERPGRSAKLTGSDDARPPKTGAGGGGANGASPREKERPPQWLLFRVLVCGQMDEEVEPPSRDHIDEWDMDGDTTGGANSAAAAGASTGAAGEGGEPDYDLRLLACGTQQRDDDNGAASLIRDALCCAPDGDDAAPPRPDDDDDRDALADVVFADEAHSPTPAAVTACATLSPEVPPELHDRA